MTDDKAAILLLRKRIQELENAAAQRIDDLNVRRLKRRAVDEALRRTGGHLTKAATLLGLERTALSDYIRRYGVERPAELQWRRRKTGREDYRGIFYKRKAAG